MDSYHRYLRNEGIRLDKQVKYLGKDFGTLRNNLIEFAKTYYPTAYNDFNESSPAMMLVEMAAYVGDVLGYYIDDTFTLATKNTLPSDTR